MEDTEKKPIDAEIIPDEEEKNEDFKPGKKIDFRFELALFLILGFLLGVVIKTEAAKRVTIGFNDNAITSLKQAYDFEKIKEEIANQNSASEQQATPEGQDNSSGQPPAGN